MPSTIASNRGTALEELTDDGRRIADSSLANARAGCKPMVSVDAVDVQPPGS